jgi:phosphohistidine phosphatase SixA
MGSFLHTHFVPLPDVAIVSPALRARQTLDSIMRTWAGPAWTVESSPFPVEFDRNIYYLVNSTSDIGYIDIVRNSDATKRRILLVGPQSSNMESGHSINPYNYRFSA